MPIIDFTGSAYRDASRGMTLKALQERLKAAETGTLSAAKPEQIADPWQGAAHVMGVIGAGIRESRAASAEQAGREQLAKILAGGVTPDEYGQLYMSDPELAGKYMEHDWTTQADAAKQAFDKAQQEARFGQEDKTNAARVQADKDAAAAQVKAQQEQSQLDAELGTDEAKWRAGLDSGRVSPEAYKLHRDQVAAEAAARAPDQWGAVPDDVAAQYGPESDVVKNRGLYHYNAKTGDVERIDANSYANMSPSQKEFDIQSSKDNQDWVATGRAQNVANNMQLDKVLGDLDKYDKSTSLPTPGGGGSVGGVFSSITGLGAPSGTLTSIISDPINRILAGGVGAPDPVTMRENVRMVAQQSLKAVLGTQFAASEGEGVMNRAYDPGAAPSENARRIKLLKIKLQQIARYNDERAAWLASHPSMQGFTGPSPAEVQADFLAYTNSPEFIGGGGGGATPPADTGGGGGDDPLAEARDAIAKGAPRDKVIERLKQQNPNLDTSGL